MFEGVCPNLLTHTPAISSQIGCVTCWLCILGWWCELGTGLSICSGMLIVWQSQTLTCVGRVWYQAYIRIGHLGIYLVFMNIFTHSKLSSLISTTGNCAAVITYSAQHSWLQRDKSAYRLYSKPSSTCTRVRVWLHHTRMQVGCIQDANMQQNRCT